MSNLMKRTLALLLVLVLCVSLIPAFSVSASAADVSYVYSGKYIYNWGTRGETATFLSPNAEDFYEEKGTSYAILSSYSGGTGKSDAPSSSLYKELQSLMKGAHSYITSYAATKELYQYTDCQNSGGKISSFYSGNQIGPSWNGSWNREHTWPKSKSLGGNDENDIMMLRPTSTSENSSRGNTAYGKSSGYYNPNSESNGKYDLRGDVARIFLYVYVRWGNTSHAWGTGGVMENVTVLLEWMEADPVDTWELGRNDSVESITGTRNVFVDYPELAFLLFGEEVPENMATPSGEGSNKCDHNNFDSGVVVAATCTDKGYTLFTCLTAGCTNSYKTSFTDAKGHNFVSGTCSTCGAAEPTEPVKPTYATNIEVGKPYKLGMYCADKGCEYYFSGSMVNTYYGATDTAYENTVDVYAENATGGYHLYFKDTNGKKQYINLVLSSDGEHYNFTYAATATSVFTWDTSKSAFKTVVANEDCYIGNFAPYFSMNVLRSSKLQDTDYIARMYTSSGSGDAGNTPGTDNTPDTDNTCKHSYNSVVTMPSCTNGGFTTYTCALCAHSYTDNKTSALGHKYTNDVCTVCGATKSSGVKSEATISFEDVANRTTFTKSVQIWEQNGIKVTNNKAGSQSAVADYSNPGRFYKGSEVIIEYPGMTKIEINCEGIADSKYISGWLNVPTGATATQNGKVITVVFDSPVDSIKYDSLSAQCRAFDIKVYAEGTGTSSSCSHKNVKVEGAVAPTCTENGHTGKTVCLDCQAMVNEGQIILATNHTWTPADCDTPKTCTVCKATEGEALGHDWIDATTEAPKTCDRCGKTEGDNTPGTTPDNDGNTDGETPDDDENTEGDTTEKDHTKCEASGFEKFLNSILNFFRTLFGGKAKCVCGEELD